MENEISFYDEDNPIPVNFRQNTSSTRSYGSYDSGSLVSADSSQDNDMLSNSYHGTNFSSLSSTNMTSAPHIFKSRKNAAFTQIHELSVAAQVEKLRWRPPKGNNIERYYSTQNASVDLHAAMLAISTSASGGAASGGHGTLSLWSCHRPFMPLSIVDGHEEGAVVDFLFLGEFMLLVYSSLVSKIFIFIHHFELLLFFPIVVVDTPEINEDDYYFISGQEDNKSLTGTWQHVISIGRDGRCIVQSLAKGERPLSNVAPSAFAITNLSPFQYGYGSLQIISAHQKVPSGFDTLLCGLRRDEFTSLAPGFYMEDLPSDNSNAISKYQWEPKDDIRSVSNEMVHLNFHVTDYGNLNELFSDSNNKHIFPNEVKIAPEVVHLSRFAEGYKICTDPSLPTKAAVCRFNAAVAATLKYEGHSRMWNILASILEGIDFEHKTNKNSQIASNDTMSFILYPTLKSLLLERADAGDVQTCVVLCEVLDVIVKQKNNSISVAIPGLDIQLVRQWYLSYIEILQQMCLFSHATHLIRNCNDPEIGKMNQTSTTIHEACPLCSKPLQSGQKCCKNCRRKIGLCFLCHEPSNGLIVMCVGCGHSGHLNHAIEWFTSLDNHFREYCPTGCGHKCNLISLPRGSNFPRTESLHQLQCFDAAS